jgi:hypothetical protein
MYIRHPESTPIEIQGITSWIPPVGMVYDRITGEWVETEIKKRSPKKSEQYWEPDRIPSWYNKRRREEERKIIELDDPDFYFDDCEEVRKQHWFWRLNGRWFYNNGEPVYITGLHWFYLSHWPIDVGLPSYFEYDKKRFYHLQYCIDDPLCFGRVEVGPRRMGKTYMGGVFLFETVSRMNFALGTIQSKTAADSKKVFGKGVVSQFRKLPHFFAPVYDTSGGTIPKSEIRFFNTSKKGSKVKISDYSEELESIIDHRSSGEYAVDGEKVHAYLGDEIFKTEECNIYNRHKVVRECLVDNITGQIIGKAFYTSTVEEVEGHLEVYQKFWYDSNPEEKDANGHTKTGLYSYFISASETRNLDKYGNCDQNKNLQIILNTIEGIKSNPKDVSDYKRKYPITIKDAFRPKDTDCHYNIEKLNDRYDLLSILDPKYITGDFRWNDPDNMKKGVKFVPKKNGKFKLHVDIDYQGEGWNNVFFVEGKPRPKNNVRFVAGNDNFDHTTTVDGRKSNGANTVFYKYDPMNPLKSDKFVCLYCHRPKKPTIFYEDMLMCYWFFGCKVLMENNKQGMRLYFEGKGCEHFLIKLPDSKDYGIAGSQKSHQSIVDHTSEYIEDCIDNVDFIELIEDWMGFDISNTTKFDLAMAGGYNLIAADRITPRVENKDEELIEVTSIFRTY